MLRWLRKHQPGQIGLAVLYWTALSLVALVLLFLLFYFVVDPLLPAMF